MTEPREPAPPHADDDGDERDVLEMHEPILREHAEPRDGNESIPVWLIILMGALLLWGGFYLARYSGDWRSDVLDENPHARRPLRAFTPPPVDPMQRGEQLYTIYCVACHGHDGRGEPGRYPPLAETEWVTGDPRVLAAIVLGGVEGPMEVRGAEYDEQMPAFRGRLHSAELAAVLTYIRASFGNEAAPVEPQSVAAVARMMRARQQPWSEAELHLLRESLEQYEDEAEVPETLEEVGIEP